MKKTTFILCLVFTSTFAFSQFKLIINSKGKLVYQKPILDETDSLTDRKDYSEDGSFEFYYVDENCRYFLVRQDEDGQLFKYFVKFED